MIVSINAWLIIALGSVETITPDPTYQKVI